jgi:hypothetical protein
MTNQANDDFDFKPFFDLIVGILFILLIMISSQLFFTQWEKTVPELEKARLSELRETEITLLLDRLAARLSKDGLQASINRSAQAVQVVLPLSTDAAANLTRVERSAVKLLGNSIFDVLSCATRAINPQRACDTYDHISLFGIDLSVTSPSASSEVGIFLAADLLEHAPTLLSMRSAAGRPLLSSAVVKSMDGAISAKGTAQISINLKIAAQ